MPYPGPPCGSKEKSNTSWFYTSGSGRRKGSGSGSGVKAGMRSEFGSGRTHSVFQPLDLVGSEAVGLGDEGDHVDLLMKGLHKLHIYRPQPGDTHTHTYIYRHTDTVCVCVRVDLSPSYNEHPIHDTHTNTERGSTREGLRGNTTTK